MSPDGTEEIVEYIDSIVLPRSAMPEGVQHFTHKSGTGVWWSNLPENRKTPAHFVHMPLVSRLNYWLHRDFQGEAAMHYMEWPESAGDLTFIADSDRPGVIFVFLEDGGGRNCPGRERSLISRRISQPRVGRSINPGLRRGILESSCRRLISHVEFHRTKIKFIPGAL